MIRSIILTTMLTFASSTGASIKKDAPLKTHETKATNLQLDQQENPSYDTSWDYPFVQQVNAPWQYNYDDKTQWTTVANGTAKVNTYTFNQKNYNFVRNNAWSIYSTMYTNNKLMAYQYISSGNIYGSLVIPYKNNTDNYDEVNNNNLFIYKLEPHNQAVTTNFTLNTKLTTKADIFNINWNGRIECDMNLWYRINILTTKNNIVEQYNNASITQATNFKSWYNNIINNASDITSETIYRKVKIATIHSNNTITTEPNQDLDLSTNLSSLGLLTNEVNYCVMLIERQMEIVTQETQTVVNFQGMNLMFQIRDDWGNVQGNRYNYYWMHNTQTSVSGTYVLNTNMEVIDMPNLMFTILGMPFTFYSTAFNLTLFAGTPYAINIGNILLTILASLIFIFVIRLVLKVFS